jgi:hypothetical protein
MSLTDLTLKQDATDVTIVGGTDLNLKEVGTDIKSGILVSEVGNADFSARTSVTFRNRQATLQSDGQYNKAKRTATLVIPFERADGVIVPNLCRIELEFDPNTLQADKDELKRVAVQLLTDAETQDFLDHGSLV